jgi:predicted Rossmann fold flavoprotein
MITEESGKVFPRSRSASDILDLLLSECRDTGVEIRCGEGVSRVTVDDDQSFSVLSARSSYRATDLVIATGGASYPSTGSTGDGYRLAESLGHTITTPSPALAPIYPDTYPFSHLSGISFPGTTLTLYRQGRKVMQLSGDLLLTHTGLSGPGILHMSRYAEPGDTLQVSFLADRSATDLTREFVAGASSEGQRLVRSFLPEYKLPARFIESILTQAGIPGTRTLAHLTKTERNRLVLLLSAYRFRVTRVGGYDEAMVTRGGICVQEVDPKTMQSRLRKRLYAIGEVLDIDGDTGGYNLQAAFSTAESAAKAILAK